MNADDKTQLISKDNPLWFAGTYLTTPTKLCTVEMVCYGSVTGNHMSKFKKIKLNINK